MSKQQLLEDLTAAKALIENPENWIQDELSQDSEGRKVAVTDTNATCFCSMGAFVHYLHGKPQAHERDLPVVAALDEASVKVSGDADMNIVTFNDTHSHAEVMAVWNNAIFTAKEQA